MGVVHQLIDELRKHPELLRELRDELDDDERLLTCVEISPRLHAHPKTIEKWCRQGRVPAARKHGRVWVMPADAVVEPPAAAVSPPHRSRAAAAIPASDQEGRDAVANMRARTRTSRRRAA